MGPARQMELSLLRPKERLDLRGRPPRQTDPFTNQPQAPGTSSGLRIPRAAPHSSHSSFPSQVHLVYQEPGYQDLGSDSHPKLS